MNSSVNEMLMLPVLPQWNGHRSPATPSRIELPEICVSLADGGRIAEVEAVLNTLRPAMEADGGGVDLVGVVEGSIEVRLKGMCLDCPSASQTMRLGIERTLKESLPWVREVHRIA